MAELGSITETSAREDERAFECERRRFCERE
jgi:hypothetical protein